MKFLKINYVKWIKLCVAVPLAMVIAQVLKLDYASSAGVITLLTVMDTRQETFVVAWKRVGAFAVMSILCKLAFGVVGCNIPAYAVFLCLFLIVCYVCRWDVAISMNAVMATHYLASGGVTPATLRNEVLLFVIGTGLGVLVNLIMPENIKKIREKQRLTDEAMKRILHRMADYLCREDKSDYTGMCFGQVEGLLAELEGEASVRMLNKMSHADRYFLKYMHMRAEQCESLKDIYASIKELSYVPGQAYAISEFIREIGDSFHEMNNVEWLLKKLDILDASYKEAELPKSREEFENRAELWHILRCLEVLLRKKQAFVKDLTQEEKKKYWEYEDAALRD